jgi:hypothetical protein
MAYNHAFRCKRQLFSAHSLLGVPTTKTGESVYDVETTLFDLIDQPKRPERFSELSAYSVVLTALIIFIILSFLGSLFSIITVEAILWACFLVVIIYRKRCHRQL